MFTIHDAPDPAPIEAWIRRSIEKTLRRSGADDRRRPAPLMKVVRRIGVEENSSPPSPGHANSRAPNRPGAARDRPRTATDDGKADPEGVAEMLSRLDLKGHRLGLQLYPDKDHGVLIGAIKALGARSIRVCLMPMTRRPPMPTSSPRSTRWPRAASDAIALTNLGQIRRLVEVARAHGFEARLRDGLARTGSPPSDQPCRTSSNPMGCARISIPPTTPTS